MAEHIIHPSPAPSTARFGAFVLNKYGAPHLSELTRCGAPFLAEPPNYLGTFVLNSVFRFKYPDPIGRIVLIFGRRVMHAVHEYTTGRDLLAEYVQRLPQTNSHYLQALRAVTHFEHCIGSTHEAIGFIERLVGITNPSAVSPKDDRANRLRLIWNRTKHFDEDILDFRIANDDICAPVWLTNEGISSTAATMTFDELHFVLSDLVSVLKSLTEDVPNQMAGRSTAQGPDLQHQ